MAKDLPVTLDGNVIYHIKLTDSFQGLAENLYYFRFECCKTLCRDCEKYLNKKLSTDFLL